MALKKIVENILIDTVRIYGFRSLRDVTVSLGRFTLLTGMNNAGKTSFLRALNLALGVDRRSVDADDFYAVASGGNDGWERRRKAGDRHRCAHHSSRRGRHADKELLRRVERHRVG